MADVKSRFFDQSRSAELLSTGNGEPMIEKIRGLQSRLAQLIKIRGDVGGETVDAFQIIVKLENKLRLIFNAESQNTLSSITQGSDVLSTPVDTTPPSGSR